MFQKLLVFTGLFLLAACSNLSKINVADIDSIYIDYDSFQPSNFGSVINGTVCVRLKSGGTECLSNNSDFNSSLNVHFDIKDKEISLLEQPRDFQQSTIPVVLMLYKKEELVFTGNDTIHVNFKGNIDLENRGSWGTNGANGADGGTGWILRNGKSGTAGQNGQNGQNGPEFELHVWKDTSGLFFIHCKNMQTNTVSRYKLTESATFTLDASGGRGGDGGNGGRGGDGQDGTISDNKSKAPGDGGYGANGGTGGSGGIGGKIVCFVHPNAASFVPHLIFSAQGGKGGSGGTGGKGGAGGKPVGNQTAGRDGATGANGLNGMNGMSGQSNISTVEFSLANYQ